MLNFLSQSPLPAFSASGKFGRCGSFGFRRYGQTGYADSSLFSGIYQMRKTFLGKVPVRMRFYAPTNPMTEAQQANRAKFAAAMSTWTGLTTEQKQPYIERAKLRQMKPWGLFVREYYQSN